MSVWKRVGGAPRLPVKLEAESSFPFSLDVQGFQIWSLHATSLVVFPLWLFLTLDWNDLSIANGKTPNIKS